MNWDIINTQPIVPKCVFCDRTSDQMARFHRQPYDVYMCSNCSRYVKDCMNEWKDLKSTDYINNDFNTRIDPL